MPGNSSSAKITRIFGTLPPEAQQTLVEKLSVLLDAVPKETSKKFLGSAMRLQTRCSKAPKLDLKGKKKEIHDLINQLDKSAKLSFLRERCNHDELLGEIIDSLTNWLNDIWTNVYEHNINFNLAHRCLLYVAQVLLQLGDSSSLGASKCIILNMDVNLLIKNNSGKVIKHFAVKGPHNVDGILLWIWRDLFMSMCAKGSKDEKAKIPSMLEDIDSILGWQALERLLYGGKKSPMDDDDDDYEDDLFGDDDSEASLNDDYCDSDDDFQCICHFHAKHWSEKLKLEQDTLRELVLDRMHLIFEVTPSLPLYQTLLFISEDIFSTEARLSSTLAKIAGSTSDTIVAALDIQIMKTNASKIASLLDSYSWMLRPRDSTTLICATAVLSDSPRYHTRALQILEKELGDSLLGIYVVLHSSFCHFEKEMHKRQFTEILNLRANTPARKERIEQWVETVMTSSSGHVHPMAFAAMMMGFPMVPDIDEGEDADIVNFIDLDHADPDLEDVREEFRPNLKGRFEDWHTAGLNMKGHAVVFLKIYKKAIELMPFLQAPDAVDEMLGRLQDRPSKAHVAGALDFLSKFCKSQRRMIALKQEKQRRNEQKTTQKSNAANRSQALGDGKSSFICSLPSSSSTSAGLASSPAAQFDPGSLEGVD